MTSIAPHPAVVDTIGRLLDRRAAMAPRHLAVIGPSGALDHQSLRRAAAAAAGRLVAAGVQPGDRVAATGPNDLDLVVQFLGAMRIGAVWVGMNKALTEGEAAFVLSDAGVTAAIGDVAGWQGTSLALASWRDHLDDDVVLPPDVDRFAPAGIAYTSGTSGRPKGVVHSQHNLLLAAHGVGSGLGIREDDRVGVVLPMTILNLQVLGPLLTLSAGATLVILDRTDAEGFAEQIAAHRVTRASIVPTILYDLVHAGTDPTLLETMAAFRCGGAPSSPDLLTTAMERFGKQVCLGYGLTEAPTSVCGHREGSAYQPGSSGEVFPHLRVEILDTSGAKVPTGTVGQICVGASTTGPLAGLYRPMLGYWGQPEATAAALAGGLLHTGDLGFVDDDGGIHIVDRMSSVIFRGGANVYPAEVERAITSLPGVAHACVVGIPDDRLGERVGAAVVASPGHGLDPASVIDGAARLLARYRRPEVVAVVDELPRNTMGKPDLRAVRALVLAATGESA